MADQIFQMNCGFFDSIDKDRLYSADEMNRPYKRIISNGVFATQLGTPSTDLQVNAFGNNMSIMVSPGEGLFADKWFQNPAVLAIVVPTNTSIVPRVDSVIVQVDKRLVGRIGNIVYRTGTPSSSPVAPAINTTDNVIEYRIANIRVEPGAIKITQANITDLRGSAECPWITSLIKQVDTSELFNQWVVAYNNYYADSTEDFTNWSAEKKAEFEQWLENLTDQLTVATNVIILSHNYLSTEAISTIPIGIPSYDKETDALMVFINGIKVTEGLNYEVDANSENIVLTTEILAGQMVNFFVLKSVIAADVQTTATMIQVLDAKVSDVQETTDRIESVSYVANGSTDNIELSKLVKAFYANNENDEKQLEINVFGTLGVFSPYSTDTLSVWFDFCGYGSKSRVKLNFANANLVDIDCTNTTESVGILFTDNLEIDNLKVNMRNCNIATMLTGNDCLMHNCIFTMSEISGGSGSMTGVRNGTLYDCSFELVAGSGEAICVFPEEDTIRLINCKLSAYNASTSQGNSIGVYSANADNVVIMSGCECPVEAKTGYKQDEVVDISNGKFCLTGNILGKAATLVSGEGRTEVGTMIV